VGEQDPRNETDRKFDALVNKRYGDEEREERSFVAELQGQRANVCQRLAYSVVFSLDFRGFIPNNPAGLEPNISTSRSRFHSHHHSVS
jgi:hypothetical protein